jgi:hypothetical protein
LLTVFLFSRWEEKRGKGLLLLTLFFQLIATLWKEIYLPLPAVIFLLASGGVKEKMTKSLPFVAVSVLYLGWRLFMLRGLGGYPWVDLSWSSFASGLLWSPLVLSRVLFFVSWLLPFLLLLLGYSLGKFLLLWIAFALPVSPILPTDYPGDFDMRLFFPLSWVAVWGIGQALQRVPARASLSGAFILCALSLTFTLPRSAAILSWLDKAGEEGRQVVKSLQEVPCPKVYLVGASVPHWYLSSMLKIQQELLRTATTKGVSLSQTGYVMSPGLIKIDTPHNPCGVFRYHGGAFAPASGEVAEEVERFLHERRGPAPLLHGSGADHTLSLWWSPVEGSAAYLVYYGDESGIYFDAIPVEKPSFVYRNFAAGTYYFTVAARYPDGAIGAPSTETAVTVP